MYDYIISIHGNTNDYRWSIPTMGMKMARNNKNEVTDERKMPPAKSLSTAVLSAK